LRHRRADLRLGQVGRQVAVGVVIALKGWRRRASDDHRVDDPVDRDIEGALVAQAAGLTRVRRVGVLATTGDHVDPAGAFEGGVRLVVRQRPDAFGHRIDLTGDPVKLDAEICYKCRHHPDP
jgi:hypothetical protein